jgi:hypothetical protein
MIASYLECSRDQLLIFKCPFPRLQTLGFTTSETIFGTFRTLINSQLKVTRKLLVVEFSRTIKIWVIHGKG